MMVRAHIFISGMVQGVFFRSETMRAAKKLSINGWVRNLPDGRVEAIFEGEEAKVKQLTEFCKRGPLGAKVENVEVIMENYMGEFRQFKIRYAYDF